MCNLHTFGDYIMHRLFLCASLMALAACDPSIQTTSGRAYLAQGAIADPEIAAAAQIEPTPLRFPARVGFLAYENGRIDLLPKEDIDLLTADVPDGFGTIVALGALEARLAGGERYFQARTEDIRRLAASRHLDYVVVMNLDPYTNTGEALFLDVRTGYPHASVEVRAPGRVRSNLFGGRAISQNRRDRSKRDVIRALKPQLEQAVVQLMADARSGV